MTSLRRLGGRYMYSSIDSFIDKKIIVLKNTDSVLRAARAMCENQVGCVLVYNDDSELVGLVTDRDITCNLISEDLDGNITLDKIMETDVVTLHESGTVLEAIEIMKEHGIRRVPVTYTTRRNQKKCIGIITLDDLIAGQFINSLDLSNVVKSQIQRRHVRYHLNSERSPSPLHSYHRFISHFSKSFDLNKKQTEEIVIYLLSCIVQRLHYTGGTHFISQLPKHLQEYLLDLPAGPNRSISLKTILQGVKLRTGFNTTSATTLLEIFWDTLTSIIGQGETQHVLQQLPNDIKHKLAPSSLEHFYTSAQNVAPPMEKL